MTGQAAGNTTTYARCKNTVLGGTALGGGPTLQDAFEGCAASCSTTPDCDGFNWCPSNATEACPVDSSGATVPKGTCQLISQQTAQDGRGVTELASGSPKLGTAGVAVHTRDPPPASLIKGYALFLAMGMLNAYDLNCSESVDVIARCNGWASCQAITVGSTWGTYGVGYGMLKGSSTGGSFDPGKGNLNPMTYTLVKVDALPAAAPAGGGGGGLSAGAIAGLGRPGDYFRGAPLGCVSDGAGGVYGSLAAGIVVGAIAAKMSLMFAGFGLWQRWQRRRRRRRPPGDSEAGAAMQSGSGSGSGCSLLASAGGSSGKQDELIVAKWGAGGGKSSATRKLLEQLVEEAPGPQWQDVVLHSHQVRFAVNPQDGRPIKLGSGASGTVYRGVLNEVTSCALKVFDFHEDLTSLPKHFVLEVSMLRRLSHPNIVQFLGLSVA
ncbi:hypothetical protein N2152v2_005534, partial [Parachlorella kessleri]